MATGSRDFLEMAVDMALSLREHTSEPLGLACDDGLAGAARDTYAKVFDEVTVVPERFLQGRVRKYGAAEASPFDKTVFVDADCIVLGSLDHLFDPLTEHDMAMLGEQLTRAENENHHGFSTRRLMTQFGLESYLKSNSGIFAFRREPALEIMEECLRCFLDEARPRLKWQILLGRWLGDEIGFGIVGGRRGVETLPEPHAMYWPQEFDDIDLDAPSKPLLHLIWPPRPPLLDRLLDDMRRRRETMDLPTESARVWRAEVTRLERMKRRRRLAERIGWW
jgi:hypothetical protein